MAVTIYRDNNSGKVIFSGVETKAADVNTLSCTIVDTDFLRIEDTTSPSNAPLFRKLHYADVNKRAFANNLAAGAGNNATEVKAYIDSQITYNATERKFSTGVIDGFPMELGTGGTTFTVGAGVAFVKSSVTDAATELRLSNTFTYNVSSVTTGKDRVFKVEMTGEETITVSEIQGALGGEAIDTDSLRTQALIGCVFYNDFLNKFTLIQTVSNPVTNIAANVGELAKSIGSKVIPSDRITLAKSNVSDVRLGIGAGSFFSTGLNKVTANYDSPNIVEVTADPDLAKMQMVDKADGVATYRLFENTTLTNEDGDSLWTKFLDDEGFMDDVDDTEWVVMPVRITLGKVLSPLNQVEPSIMVCVGQRVIEDTKFKNNRSLEIANALNTYEFPKMLHTNSALIGCIAMRGDATDFADSEKVYIVTGDQTTLLTAGIEEAAAAVDELFEFDYVVDPTANAGGNGSLATPYQTISEAVAGVPDGSTILLKNTANHVVTGTISLSDSITFIGEEGTKVGYSSWNNSNDVIFQVTNTSSAATYKFRNIELINAAEAMDIRGGTRVELVDVNTKNIGHSGIGHNYGGEQVVGKLGYDSLPFNLQLNTTQSDFANNAAVGIDIMNVNQVDITSCEFSEGLNALRLYNCGTGAGVFLKTCRFYNLIGTAMLAEDCNNFIAYNNYFSNISGVGIEVDGGIDVIIGLNVMKNLWNEAVVARSTANFRFRDNDVQNAALGAVDYGGNSWTFDSYITVNGTAIFPSAEFCIDVVGNEFIHNDNTGGIGIYMSFEKNFINDPSSVVCKFENNGYKNFHHIYDLDANLDLVTVLRDGNSFINLGNTIGSYGGLNTQYFSLPYSAQAINLTALDVQLDATSSRVTVKEGSDSNDIVDIYGINDLQAIDKGTIVRIVLRNSNKIQYCNLSPDDVTIAGAAISSTVSEVVDALNALFTNSGNFLSTGQLDNTAPAISAQTTDIEEAQPLNYQIALDTGSNTASVWEVTGLPNWITHNGTGLLQGTAPAWTDSASDVFTITAKVANSYGGDYATVQITVLEEADVNNTYYSFDGSNDIGRTNTSTNSNNPFYRNGNGNGYAWAFSVTFNDVDNPTGSSKKPIIFMGSTTGFVLERKQNNLRFRFGDLGESNNNLQFNYNNFFATASSTGGGSGSSYPTYGETKVSILVTYDGRATGAGSANVSDYYDAFRIYLIEEDETITRIDNKGGWSNDDFGYTGNMQGWTYFGYGVGSLYSATRLYGVAIMTCRQGAGGSGIQELSTDTERIMFARDYPNYIDTYQTNRTYRRAGSTLTYTNWAVNSTNSAMAARFYEFFLNTTQDVFPFVQNLSQPASTFSAARVQIVNGSSSQLGND